MRRTEEKHKTEWLNADDEKTKWSRIKTFSGLDNKSSSDMEIITNFGPTKSGPVLLE